MQRHHAASRVKGERGIIISLKIINNQAAEQSGFQSLLFETFILTSDELSNLHVIGLPQQADQGRDAVTVLDGHLVVIVLAVGDVAQGAASLAVHFGFGVVQKPHQNRNALQLAHVLLNLVIFVAQVLQVGSGVGLDGVDGVAQHGDDFGEVWVAPARVLADAVYGW